jgi:hypothetical protein
MTHAIDTVFIDAILIPLLREVLKLIGWMFICKN